MINQILRKYRQLLNIKPKSNVILIGGGEVFEKYDDYIKWLKELQIRESTPSWKSWLSNKLYTQNISTNRIQMPCTWNAHYNEWEIWFEKYLSKINNKTHLVGHSLGGIFLIKYLSQNSDLLKKIGSVHLIAAPFNYCFDFNVKKSDVPNHSKIYCYQSTDDDIVRIKDSIFHIYSKSKNNQVNMFKFNDKGHFLVPQFFELYDNIIQLSTN